MEIIRKEDTTLEEKSIKFYTVICDIFYMSEDIIEYVLDADRKNDALDKSHYFLHRTAKGYKNIEVTILLIYSYMYT